MAQSTTPQQRRADIDYRDQLADPIMLVTAKPYFPSPTGARPYTCGGQRPAAAPAPRLAKPAPRRAAKSSPFDGLWEILPSFITRDLARIFH